MMKDEESNDDVTTETSKPTPIFIIIIRWLCGVMWGCALCPPIRAGIKSNETFMWIYIIILLVVSGLYAADFILPMKWRKKC